ncbi:putative protein isoform X1 [Capsicum chacoense]
MLRMKEMLGMWEMLEEMLKLQMLVEMLKLQLLEVKMLLELQNMVLEKDSKTEEVEALGMKKAELTILMVVEGGLGILGEVAAKNIPQIKGMTQDIIKFTQLQDLVQEHDDKKHAENRGDAEASNVSGNVGSENFVGASKPDPSKGKYGQKHILGIETLIL